MRCGVDVSRDDLKVRNCLWYGRKVRFCKLSCQRAWLEEWFGVSANLKKNRMRVLELFSGENASFS